MADDSAQERIAGGERRISMMIKAAKAKPQEIVDDPEAAAVLADLDELVAEDKNAEERVVLSISHVIFFVVVVVVVMCLFSMRMSHSRQARELKEVKRRMEEKRVRAANSPATINSPCPRYSRALVLFSFPVSCYSYFFFFCSMVDPRAGARKNWRR
jgi:hypothetical protein